MNEVEFQAIVDALPAPKIPSGIKVAPEYSESFGVVTNQQAGFVAPNFSSESTKPSTESKVLLIAAPAAVGKSFLARELSHKSGNFLLDLGAYHPGTSFFSGFLNEALDFAGQTGSTWAKQSLLDGSLALIIDAADEAFVSVTAKSFTDAIRSLAKLLDGAPLDRPSCVILGRPDTMREIREMLDDNGVNASIINIDFFDKEQSKQFIRNYASKFGKQQVAKELDEFVDNFFEVTTAAMSGHDVSKSELDSFIGYSPVLESLGRFYEQSENPIADLMRIRKDANDRHVWLLIADILGMLIERESVKFVRGFAREQLELYPSEFPSSRARIAYEFYSEHTQLRLLFAEEPGEVDLFDALEGMTGDQDAILEEFSDLEKTALKQFNEHPLRNAFNVEEKLPLQRFVNVAFRDYCAARAFVSQDVELIESVVDQYMHGQVPSSPLLSRFLLSGGDECAFVPASVLTAICESQAQVGSFGEILRIQEMPFSRNASGHGEAESDNVTLSVELSLDGETLGSVGMEVSVDESLHLSAALARTELIIPSLNVDLGEGSGQFTFGPRAVLEANSVEVNASEFRVPSSGGQVSLLRSNSVLGLARDVVAVSSEFFQIRGDGPYGYPWVNYHVKRSSLGAGERSEAELRDAGLQIKKNVGWFLRDSMDQGYAYPANTFELVLAKNRASTAVHEFFCHKGWISREGISFVLDIPNVQMKSVVQVDLDDPGFKGLVNAYLDYLDE